MGGGGWVVVDGSGGAGHPGFFVERRKLNPWIQLLQPLIKQRNNSQEYDIHMSLHRQEP